MHLAAGIFLLGVIDELVHIALHRSIAAGGVGIEATACVHREVSGLLHRLHRESSGRLDDDRPLATDPRDDGWPVFVVMPPTGFTFLAAPSRSCSVPITGTMISQ